MTIKRSKTGSALRTQIMWRTCANHVAHYTLRELVRYAGKAGARPRPVIGLGSRLSYLQAAALEFLPGKLMTRDNVRSMGVDSTCTSAFPFGIRPTPLEAVAPNWLAKESPRTRFQPFRVRARR